MNVRLLCALVGALMAGQNAFARPQTQNVEWASAPQEAAWRYGPKPQLASGGWGSGKTFVYCKKALWLSDTFPKNRGVIFRSVGKELRATTMATFFKLCPPSAYDPRYGGRRNDQEGRLVLNNGSEILFMHMEDPDVQGVIRGLEINWFFGDQLEEDPANMETIWDMLLGRLSRWDVAEVPEWLLAAEKRAGREWAYVNPRTGQPMPPPYAMGACNPDTEVHWLYRRFHPESAEHYEKLVPELGPNDQPTGRLLSYHDLGYKLFEIHSYENKYLPASNKQALLAHDAAFVNRNYFGRWGFAEGTIHVIDILSLVDGSAELLEYFRASCTLYRFMDHGDSAPTCVLWFAVDRNGNCFCFREYYQPNALISTHRANVYALSEYEVYERNQADPSIFAKTMQRRGDKWSVADEWKDSDLQDPKTAVVWQPAENNELGTRNRINEYLQVDPDRVHPITGQKGAPRLYFVRTSRDYPQGCMHVLRETRSQRRVKIGSDLGKAIFSDERDESIPDHAYDPLRYFIASRPSVPRVTPADRSRKTFAGRQRQAAALQQQLQRRR